MKKVLLILSLIFILSLAEAKDPFCSSPPFEGVGQLGLQLNSVLCPLMPDKEMPEDSRQNRAFAIPQELRRFEARGINEECPSCPKFLNLTDSSINHSLQHYPETEVRNLETALPYARKDRITSIINPAIPLEEIVKKFHDKKTRFQPDYKALRLVEADAKTVGYYIHLTLDTPPALAGKYEFFVVVCRKKTCNDDSYGTFRSNIFKEGDIISIYPNCGPGVFVIPKANLIKNYQCSNPSGMKGMGEYPALLENKRCETRKD